MHGLNYGPPQVEDLLAKHDWIATEKQYFGKVNTAYDFGAYNLKEASRKLARLQEEKVSEQRAHHCLIQGMCPTGDT